MLKTSIKVSQDILDKLGEAGVRDACECLWAVDCQTCGRFLGDEPPALVVDDSLAFAAASLHHLACREPVWNDSGVITQNPDENLSWVSVMLMFPVVTASGGQQDWPMLLVNPSLEQVPLVPDGHGGYKVRRSAVPDIQPCSLGLSVGSPLSDAVATLSTDSIGVSLGHRTYTAPADDLFLKSARTLGGVLVGFTHALHPDQLTAQVMNQAILGGWIGVGRVMLHGTEPPASPPVPSRTPSTLYTLEWNAKYVSVGRVLDHTSDGLDAPAAIDWAEKVIGVDAALIDWTLVDKDNPDEGWTTLDALSLEMYFLRRHPDGWRVIAAYARVAGHSGVESDNEAKAWARGHLARKGQPTTLSWAPGPSTPAAQTLYAQA